MHPFASHAQGIMERKRVGKILHGDGVGKAVRGAVSAHEARLNPSGDTKLKAGGTAHGSRAALRLDKPHRAKGGRVKKAGVNVNVVVAPHRGDQGNRQMAGAAASLLPPTPPGPGVGGPPPMAGPGPMPMPPGMPMRAKGGRVRKGQTPAKAEGMRNGTQPGGKPAPDDKKDMRTFPPITYARGGRIRENSYHKGLGMTAGAVSGEGRLQKIALQKKAKK